jgi:hypothetical protein
VDYLSGWTRRFVDALKSEQNSDPRRIWGLAHLAILCGLIYLFLGLAKLANLFRLFSVSGVLIPTLYAICFLKTSKSRISIALFRYSVSLSIFNSVKKHSDI